MSLQQPAGRSITRHECVQDTPAEPADAPGSLMRLMLRLQRWQRCRWQMLKQKRQRSHLLRTGSRHAAPTEQSCRLAMCSTGSSLCRLCCTLLAEQQRVSRSCHAQRALLQASRLAASRMQVEQDCAPTDAGAQSAACGMSGLAGWEQAGHTASRAHLRQLQRLKRRQSWQQRWHWLLQRHSCCRWWQTRQPLLPWRWPQRLRLQDAKACQSSAKEAIGRHCSGWPADCDEVSNAAWADQHMHCCGRFCACKAGCCICQPLVMCMSACKQGQEHVHREAQHRWQAGWIAHPLWRSLWLLLSHWLLRGDSCQEARVELVAQGVQARQAEALSYRL